MLAFNLFNELLWSHYLNNQPLLDKLGKLLNFLNFTFLICFTLITAWCHWLNYYHKNTAKVWSFFVIFVNFLAIAYQLSHNYNFFEVPYFDRLPYFVVDLARPVGHLNLISMNLVNLVFTLYVTTRCYLSRSYAENSISKISLVLSSVYFLFFCYNLPIACNVAIYFFLFVFTAYRCKKKLIDETAPHFNSGKGGWERRKAAILRIILNTVGEYWLGKQLIFVSFIMYVCIYELRMRYNQVHTGKQDKKNEKSNSQPKTPPRYPDNSYRGDNNELGGINTPENNILWTPKGRSFKRQTSKRQTSKRQTSKRQTSKRQTSKRQISRMRNPKSQISKIRTIKIRTIKGGVARRRIVKGRL